MLTVLAGALGFGAGFFAIVGDRHFLFAEFADDVVVVSNKMLEWVNTRFNQFTTQHHQIINDLTLLGNQSHHLIFYRLQSLDQPLKVGELTLPRDFFATRGVV